MEKVKKKALPSLWPVSDPVNLRPDPVNLRSGFGQSEIRICQPVSCAAALMAFSLAAEWLNMNGCQTLLQPKDKWYSKARNLSKIIIGTFQILTYKAFKMKSPIAESLKTIIKYLFYTLIIWKLTICAQILVDFFIKIVFKPLFKAQLFF